MYTCENHRPVTHAESMRDAAEIIAARKARAQFGRRAYVRTLHLESWSQDNAVGEWTAFIGVPSVLGGTVGRNVRFTVTRRN